MKWENIVLLGSYSTFKGNQSPLYHYTCTSEVSGYMLENYYTIYEPYKKQRIYKFGCLLVHLLSLKFVSLTGYCSKVFKRLHSRKQKYKSKSSEASRNLGNYIRRKRCREFISVNHEIFRMHDFEIFGSWKKKDNNWL